MVGKMNRGCNPDVPVDSERLRGVLDEMREGMQILSRDWRYLYVNEAVAHGRCSREELL